MNGDKFLTVLGTIVTVALVTTIVVNGEGTARVISSFFSGFANSLKAAQGN